MKTIKLWVSLLCVVLILGACRALQAPTIIKYDSIDGYKYVYITPTSGLTSGAGEVFNGYGATTTKSINPSDIIAGELIKRNFIIVPKLEPQLADKTLIVSYGETDRRYRGLGYTIEVTLQFVSAKSHEMVCSCTAEGQGETEADDIRMAIQRAISGLFRQRYY
ncbi:hypothetical protein QUW17_13155 [Bacteroides gallinaceum]|uniref:hypothetical protein n=1 Tax=Bacteroides gallinaceum TaxID=1462571 RepID=UPI001D4B7C27|nr:hypothetical protein [Bacteroides gallinaceum]MBW9200243.1 hypothetical protein [Bacteroidales bacterium SW299]MDM8208803.1 hypothetical protein [Bacteroides gallinaceum]